MTYSSPEKFSNNEVVLGESIRAAFGDTDKPPVDTLTDLQYKRSNELGILSFSWPEAYERREEVVWCDEFCLLTDSGFRYYLPCFMLCCLGKPPNPDILERIESYLVTPHMLRLLVGTLTEPQLEVVCSFIRYLASDDAWPSKLDFNFDEAPERTD